MDASGTKSNFDHFHYSQRVNQELHIMHIDACSISPSLGGSGGGYYADHRTACFPAYWAKTFLGPFCKFCFQNSSPIFTFRCPSVVLKRDIPPYIHYMTFYTTQTKYFLKAYGMHYLFHYGKVSRGCVTFKISKYASQNATFTF